MADTLETLEIKVVHNSTGAAANISSVTASIQAMGAALAEVLPQLKSYSDALKTLSKTKVNIGNTVTGGSSSGTPSAWAQAQADAIEDPDHAGGIESLREALDAQDISFLSNLFSNIKESVEGVGKAFSSLGKSAKEGLGKAADAASRVSSTIKNATAPVHDFGQKLADAGRGKIRSAMSGASNAIKSLNERVKESLPGLANFLSSLKRIAMYRILRTIIKEITSAFSEGLQNAYAFSEGISTEGHRFAAALNGMKTAGSNMTNQLGSAFIALLATIAPVINKIMSLISSLANALSQLFAIFTGGTYLKAVEVPQQWADAAGGAASAAKEWKNQLLGFDEINRLEAPDGGGGGGGGGGINPAAMFEDTPIDGIFAKIKAKLDELKNSLNFEPLIKSWEHLKQAVSGFADVVKSALAWAWENILKPLAHWVIEEAAPRLIELLAKAFELLSAVLNRLKPVFQWVWENVLQPIAKWVGTAFTQFLDTVISLIDKLIKLLNGETSFKEFLGSLTTGEGILLALAAGFILVNGVMLIFNGIVSLVTGIVGVFGAAIAALTSPIGLAVLAITALVAAGVLLYQHWDQIAAYAQSVWARITGTVTDGVARVEAAFDNLRNMSFKDIFRGIDDAMRNMFEKLLRTAKNIFDKLNNFIKTGLEKIRSLFKIDIQFPHIKLPHFSIDGQFSLMPPSVPHISVAYYAQGGFPEDGLFFANHNELVGKFANGMTAVANNEQIIEGIKQGVIEAMSLVLGSNDSGRKNTEFVLNLNGREFARAIYNDQNAVQREHGQSLISSYRGY
jgi:phage-related protein